MISAMNRIALTVLSVVLLQSAAVESARILVFFCQSARSHHLVFHPVIRALALRGHEVDYFTHVPLSDPPKNVNQFVFAELKESMQAKEDMSLVTQGQTPAINVEHFMRSSYIKLPGSDCENYQEFQKLLSSDKTYDMVIGEFFFYQEHFSYLLHRFGALGVAFSSNPDHTWVNEISGLPDNPSYMSHFFTDFSDRLNFVERVKNTIISGVVKMLSYYYVSTLYQRIADEKIRYPGWENRTSLTRQAADLALILTNSHHSLGYPFPTAPHVKGIMGTNIVENPKPLPKDFQDYMDSAEHGVVFFSWGSILSVKELKSLGAFEPLVKILGSLKQKVLWKWTSWSGEEPPVLPNIKFSTWMPQQSILAHNKTKLFITHGGLGGMSEAITYGVPMIGFPVFADQHRNIRLMATAGFGVAVDIHNITETSVSWAIAEVLNNPRYKEEARRRSLLFRDRLMKPVDEAVYWIEYVLRHGKALQPASATTPFYQLYLLDVVSALAVTVLTTYVVFKSILSRIIGLILNRRQRKTKAKRD